MEKNENMGKYINYLCQKYGISPNSIKKINMGYSRMVFVVNDKYVFKICVDASKEIGAINEINFLLNNNCEYFPELFACDIQKGDIPYVYSIEKYIQGNNLFEVWDILDTRARDDCLYELLNIMKIIHEPSCDNNIETFIKKYDVMLEQIKNRGLLSSEEILYLELLKSNLPQYFENVKFCPVHGDIHFNNILYTNGMIKIIDFENYQIAPIDKDFDSIFRMVRNPNSFIKQGVQSHVSNDNYVEIIDFFKTYYPEVCCNLGFNERILIYDCFNSLKWYICYPDYNVYKDILFNKSKTLIKQRK